MFPSISSYAAELQTQIQPVINHIKKNKTKYLLGGAALVTLSATAYLVQSYFQSLDKAAALLNHNQKRVNQFCKHYGYESAKELKNPIGWSTQSVDSVMQSAAKAGQLSHYCYCDENFFVNSFFEQILGPIFR